ncbi:MAG: DEAD/DEAH box helicase [Euryarchaeota archaeon]|nr:DEAD/DEAH box helicase [Euryarchaeota archaeon]
MENNDILKIIKEIFGIRELYYYQKKALPCVLEGRNVIVAAPTAAGKTIIGYIGIVNSLLLGKRAIYLTPLKTLAEEKYRELKELERLGYITTISTGDYDKVEKEVYKSDVVVCTYEKFDSMLRHDKNILNNVGTLVADEIHMVGDPERGPALEISLTKTLLNEGTQIIGLSATMPNGEDLAKWLDAVYIHTDWRPVKLYKGIHYKDKIILYDGSEPIDYISLEGPDITHLLKYFLENKGQALIFVNARNRAENLANKLSDFASKYVDPASILKNVSGLSKEISRDGITELERKDYQLMLKGIAFHHAGLSLAARSTIEHAFLRNIIKIIVATPTLAAGCNLPARVSIVLDVYRYGKYGIDLISRREVEQMIGRAGRPQYDKEGYGLIHASTQRSLEEIYHKYFVTPMEPVYSNLSNRRALRAYTLSFVVERPQTYNSIIELFSKTFFGWIFGVEKIRDVLSNILTYLLMEDFIKHNAGRYEPTPLGKRVSELYIDPLTAAEFKRFIEECPSRPLPHPIEVFYVISRTPDMNIRLTPSRSRISYILEKIEEDEVLSEVFSRREIESDDDIRALFVAFILNDWINEMPESILYEKWNIGIGDLRVLTNTAEWLVYSLAEISRMLGSPLYDYFVGLTFRVKYGVKEELIPLVVLRNVGRKRAREMYKVGIKSPRDIVKIGISGLKRIPGIGDELAKVIYEEALKFT